MRFKISVGFYWMYLMVTLWYLFSKLNIVWIYRLMLLLVQFEINALVLLKFIKVLMFLNVNIIDAKCILTGS